MHDFTYMQRDLRKEPAEFWQHNQRVFLHLDCISSFQSDLCMSQGLGVDGFHQFCTLLWASIMSFKESITLLESGEEHEAELIFWCLNRYTRE